VINEGAIVLYHLFMYKVRVVQYTFRRKRSSTTLLWNW